MWGTLWAAWWAAWCPLSRLFSWRTVRRGSAQRFVATVSYGTQVGVALAGPGGCARTVCVGSRKHAGRGTARSRDLCTVGTLPFHWTLYILYLYIFGEREMKRKIAKHGAARRRSRSRVGAEHAARSRSAEWSVLHIVLLLEWAPRHAYVIRLYMRRCRWAPPSRASSYLPLPLVQSRTQCRGRSVQDCRERPEHMYSSQSKVARVPTLTSHQAPTLAAAKEGRCPCRHALWPLVSATNATH